MTCSICQGTGWISPPFESEPRRCECVAKAEAERQILLANIPDRFASARMSTFDVGRRSSATDAFLAVSKWAIGYPDVAKRGVLLVGGKGTGKTHIAVSALREVIARGTAGVFSDYTALLDHIKAGYDGKDEENRAYRRSLHSPMFLIDDLGQHRYSDWVADTMAGIITHRLNNNLGLLATTNLPLSRPGRDLSGQRDLQDTLEDRIGAQAYAKLLELCQVVRIA